MKGFFRVLSLFGVLFFFSLPFVILVSYRVEELKSREDQEILLQKTEARKLLNEITYSCSLEFQLKRVLTEFHQDVSKIIAGSPSHQRFELVRERYKTELEPRVPVLHLWVSAGEPSGNGKFDLVPVFWNSSIPEFPDRVATYFHGLMDHTGPRSEAWYATSTAIFTRLFEFPFSPGSIEDIQGSSSLGGIKQKKEGAVLCFNSIQGQKGLFWYYPESSYPRVFVGAILDMEKIPEGFEIRQLLTSSRSESAGQPGFIPRISHGTLSFNPPLIPERVRKFVEGELTGKTIVSYETVFENHYITAAPNLVGTTGTLYVVKPLVRQGAGKVPEFLLLTSLLLLWAPGVYFILKKLLVGVGPRLMVGYALLFAFFTITFLPFSIAKKLVRDYLGEEKIRGREKAAKDLHRSLEKIDDGYNLLGADLLMRLHATPQTRKFQDLTGGNLTKAKRLPLLKHLFQSTKTIYPIESDSAMIFLALGGEGNLQEGRMGNNLNTEAMASADEMVGKLFGPLLTKAVSRENPEADLGEGSEAFAPSQKLSLNDVQKEMTEDFVFQLLCGVLGAESFYRLLANPSSLVHGKAFSAQINFTTSKILEGGLVRFFVLWFWTGYNLEEDYLRLFMDKKPFFRNPNLELMNVRKAEYLGWPQLPRDFPIPEAMWSLIDRARRVEVPQVSYELEGSRQMIMEVLPGKNLGLYFLGGFFSLKDMLERQEFMERGFQVLEILFGVLALIVVLLVQRHFTKPLKELNEGIQSLDRQAFEVRLDETRGDEFGSLAAVFNVMAKGLKEGSILGKYVSSAVQAVVKNEEAFKKALAGERREMTVLFSGLHGFEEIRNHKSPREVFDILGRHLQSCSDGVRKHGGVIDKVIGEKVMMFFDHATLGGGPATLAKVLEVSKAIGEAFQNLEVKPVMGINSGVVVAGILGSKDVRLDYTVIGDPVNLAARLAALAHEVHGSGIVISGSSKKFLPSSCKLEKLSQVRVKGKNEEIEAFLLLDSKG